jgi:undecaprenyl-diphosphatase
MDIIEVLKAIFLGVVEGITEWLPISSTGHLLLADEFIKLKMTDDFMSMFHVVVQLGAIMAVVVLYFQKLWPFTTKEKYFCKKDTWNLWFKIFVAIVPAMVIGIPFEDKIEEKFHNPYVIATMLIIYGILFIVIEKRKVSTKGNVTKLSDITYKMAFFIGAFQVLSLIPGTSRSGATIIGAMLIGASRFVATEFTFFLAVPVMFGASFIKLLKFGFDFNSTEIIVLVAGMITAFLVSVLAIKFLLSYIKRNNFVAFGWYRIVLGCLVLGYFLLGQ